DGCAGRQRAQLGHLMLAERSVDCLELVVLVFAHRDGPLSMLYPVHPILLYSGLPRQLAWDAESRPHSLIWPTPSSTAVGPWFALPARIVPGGHCSPTPASGGGGAAAPPHGVPAQSQAWRSSNAAGAALRLAGRVDDPGALSERVLCRRAHGLGPPASSPASRRGRLEAGGPRSPRQRWDSDPVLVL